MLNFKVPEIEDKEWACECLSHVHSMNCEYTFGNLFLWRAAYKINIAKYDGFLICRWHMNNDYLYSLPLGEGNFKEAINEIIENAKSLGAKPQIYGVTESYKAVLDSDFEDKFTYNYDSGNYDYIYNVEDLANLSGKKYHSKRNHITNFKKNNPDWSFEIINSDNIEECIKLHTEWIYNKDDESSDEDYSLEFEAVLNGFENYDKIGFLGALIRVEGKPIAYTYGEALSPYCFVTHFEKAPADMQGAYAVINQEFAKLLLERGYKFVNREEDLGIEGLRKAKQSYKPAVRLKKGVAVYNG